MIKKYAKKKVINRKRKRRRRRGYDINGYCKKNAKKNIEVKVI